MKTEELIAILEQHPGKEVAFEGTNDDEPIFIQVTDFEEVKFDDGEEILVLV